MRSTVTGNASERSDSIFLDRTAPMPLLVSCSTCSFHGGTAYTNDATRQVVLDLLATDNSGWVDLVDVTGLGSPASYAAVLAVTLVRGRARLHEVATADEVRGAMTHVPFALNRLARGGRGSSGGAAAGEVGAPAEPARSSSCVASSRRSVRA